MHPRSLFGSFMALLLLCGALGLTACTTQPLLDQVTISESTFAPVGALTALDVSYRIGRTSTVSIYLLDAQGQRYDLRRDEPRIGDSNAYRMRFDGTVPTNDAVVLRRLLPSGDYTVVVAARATDGTATEQRLPLKLVGSDVPLPDVENLVIFPTVISPNADAIADVTEITYRLPMTATVDITLTGADGSTTALVTRSEEGPEEQRFVWNGHRPDDTALPTGVYTLTVSAQDDYGNLVQRQGIIELRDVGQPEARIVYASIAPRRVMLGASITVTVRIKNTGTVPIRTYGPASGFTYTTEQVFSSVENGRYTAQAGGFWRIGLDWDANSGGGPKRYPYRWAVSDRPAAQWHTPGVEDWLMPNEEVEVLGHVVILQPETKMGFYVGLIQDGVGFFQDRSARTIIEVGF